MCQGMKPTQFIKIVTGKLIETTNADIEELAKDYRSSEDDSARSAVDRFRVRQYLKECLEEYKSSSGK